MKTAIVTAVSALALAVVAGPAMAKEPSVEIRSAVARVSVVVEDRNDIAVEVEHGSSGLPRVQVSRRGDEVRIDGGLRRGGLFGGGNDGIRQCDNGRAGSLPGEGASVQVRDVGRVDLSDAPLILVRVPRNVEVDASGAIFGSVGRGARSVELNHGGCGRWDVANVDGPVTLAIGGSGDIRTGSSRALDVSIGGSGSVLAGATRDLNVAIGGSGDVRVARLDGDLEVAIGGSGDVDVRSGSAPKVDISIAGSGDVNFGGVAGDVDVSIFGGGDVTIARATGSVSRSIMGGGDVRIGN
ncbi:GIN domain-containing protein [Brevundimonas sp. GCM10030266]|uniref:GIN domain-containing protein n=1 Tax=Brevundimonas sp. GCM10030266 TaxID=3273386 RepID=UPI0036174233